MVRGEPTREFGDRGKLPQWGPGGASAQNEFWCILNLTNARATQRSATVVTRTAGTAYRLQNKCQYAVRDCTGTN